MDRDVVRALMQQLLQMSQGKQTVNVVFPHDIEPKNIRFTPKGIIMIDAGRDIQHTTPINFIMTYWIPRVMRSVAAASSPIVDTEMIKALKGIDGLEVKKDGETYKFEVQVKNNERWDRVVVLKNQRGEEIGFFELSTQSIGFQNASYIKIPNEKYRNQGFARLILDEVRKVFPDGKAITTEIASEESLIEIEKGTPLASTRIVRLFESAGWEFSEGGYYNGLGEYHKEPFGDILYDDRQKEEEGFVVVKFKARGVQPYLPGFSPEETDGRSSSPIKTSPNNNTSSPQKYDSEFAPVVSTATYDITGLGRLAAVHEKLIEILKQRRPDMGKDHPIMIVDVGPGKDAVTTFDLVKMLDQQGFKNVIIYGVDNNPKVVSEAKDKLIKTTIPPDFTVEFKEGTFDLEKLGLNNIDVVITANVLFYYSPSAQTYNIGLAKKALKGDGGVLITAEDRSGDLFGDIYSKDSIEPFEKIEISHYEAFEARIRLSELYGEDWKELKKSTIGSIIHDVSIETGKEMPTDSDELAIIEEFDKQREVNPKITYTQVAREYLQSKPDRSVSSPVVSDKGGIDLRTLPITTQPVLSVATGSIPALSPLTSINLGESLGQMQNMLKAEIIPSSERIKEYLQSCCGKKNMDQEIDKILVCIADILRLQEERVVSTDLSLKEMLALLESNRPANEMQIVLAKIIIEGKEPVAITQ